jgi:CelD/BcsL family acetyltransferase involved in cellulose biosynthesis
LSAGDVRRWGELARSTATPNPFYEPGFVQAAVEHLPCRRTRVLVADEGDEWIGLTPVARGLRWRKVLAPALTVSAHPYCFLDAPLMARGREEEAAVALLLAARQGVGLVAFDRLPVEGPAASAITTACEAFGAKPVEWRRFERAALNRRAVDDYVDSMLSGRARRELRRRRRLLEDEFGACVEVVERAGDPQAVEDFLTMEAAGWKGERGTALLTVDAARFFRAVCRTFADAGRLQLLELRAGTRAVAMQCSLVSGDGLFCFKIAYDETFARLAPGTQLMAETASAFHRRPDLQWVDSCTEPGAEAVNRLWPDRRQLVTLLVPGDAATAGVATLEAALAARLARAARAGLPARVRRGRAAAAWPSPRPTPRSGRTSSRARAASSTSGRR